MPEAIQSAVDIATNPELAEVEQEVIDRLNNLGEHLNLDFWPENMGMILAAEGLSARFSFDNSIVKAVWVAELTNDQLVEICSKLQDEYRLFDADSQNLKQDILVLGRLLTRIQIDFKNIFQNDPKLKVSMLKSLLKSLEVIFNEYEKEKSGDIREINAKDYFETYIMSSIGNLKAILKSDIVTDRNETEKIAKWYQLLLAEIQSLNPKEKMARQEVVKLRDRLSTIYSIKLNHSSKPELVMADDDELDETFRLFAGLKLKYS